MADHDTHDHTGIPGCAGSDDLDAIIAASAGQDIADALAGAAAPDAGNVFATIADIGGGAQPHNELDAAALVNATATGDAGNRADHFAGTSLGGAWTREATALAAGPTVKYSSFGGSAAGVTTHYVETFTPSGAFRIECRCWFDTQTNFGNVGVIVRDSGSGDASGEAMIVMCLWNAGALDTRLVSMDAGVQTGRSTVTLSPRPGWLYLYIARNGSNVWSAGWSLDRTYWLEHATHSKTFTVAKMGPRMDGIPAFGYDFIDVTA